ncbi:hypothetical protein CHS0354_024835 [Potamilus streckersoni]|uniref:Uncharacterized protein n=1 Tax=Potamilus streckersoni TaxID=2493646 RepID=A0AAE0T0F7_9BIVA|nr:hypothetical protein CHS0354_024835 [Potamilus streckersoni]
MKMEKGLGRLAALFLCILFTQKGFTYEQMSFDNDLHRKLKGLFVLTDRSPADGYINLDEFISIVLDKDFNGDNSISRQEWISVDTGIGIFDVATANRIFQAFDSDKNDAITLPDVIATFNTIDAAVKRDGKVSAFEFLIAYIRLVTAIPNKKNP